MIRKTRLHDGKVVVMRSNLRWCSDVFEITCWNGEIVRIVFVIDAHDREVLAWHAVAGAGVSGSMVRDLMLQAVELRFATIQAPHAVEWLSDNGSPFTATSGQQDGDKAPFNICECVNLRVAPSTRAANSLLLLPPFPPAAERCAFTCVESIICVSMDRPLPASSRNRFSQTPRRAQRTKRIEIVVAGP